MAEFPEIGRHCAVDICKQLDFTPFCCDQCEKYYCVQHRFAHECRSKRVVDTSIIDQSSSSTTPLKPYICSFVNCKSAEHIKIVCRACKLNYCLAHRHCVDHKCTVDSSSTSVNHQSIEKTRSTPQVTVLDFAVRRVENKTEQSKLDRIAMMRAKMQSKVDVIIETEKLCLIVECGCDYGRYAVVFSKRWSVGRCIDHLVKMLKIERIMQSPQIYKENHDDGSITRNLLNIDTTIDRLCNEGETIHFIIERAQNVIV